MISSLKAGNVNGRGPLGGKKGEGGVGVGSLAPTRDKCGRAFAPRASRGGIPSKLRVIICKQKRMGCTKGEIEANTAQNAMAHKTHAM